LLEPGRHEIEDQVAEGEQVVTRLTAHGVHQRDLPGSPPPAGEQRTVRSVHSRWEALQRMPYPPIWRRSLPASMVDSGAQIWVICAAAGVVGRLSRHRAVAAPYVMRAVLLPG
jgi:hypothetical protein